MSVQWETEDDGVCGGSSRSVWVPPLGHAAGARGWPWVHVAFRNHSGLGLPRPLGVHIRLLWLVLCLRPEHVGRLTTRHGASSGHQDAEPEGVREAAPLLRKPG